MIREVAFGSPLYDATVRFRERGTKHLALAWAPLKKL